MGLPLRLILAVVLFTKVVLFPCAAPASPIVLEVLLHAAAEAAIHNSESVALTAAVAHTPTGTGGIAAQTCFQESGPSFFNTSAVCRSSDFFAHATPPGNDRADANASASSSILGGGAASTSPTAISKGDFAAAAAYARSGFQISVNAALPQGTPAAAATITLPGGSTFTASTDPEISFFGLVVSDLGLTELNGDLLTHEVGGLAIKGYLPPDEIAHLESPTSTYWALLAELDGRTGEFSVQNFGSLVTNPLTLADFQDISTPDTLGFQLVGDRTFTLNIPAQGGAGSTQSIVFDEAELHVGAAPEPSALVLLGSGLAGLMAWRIRRMR